MSMYEFTKERRLDNGAVIFSSDIVVKYRICNGKIQKRRWNKKTKEWVDKECK